MRNSMAAANTKPILISNAMYGTLSSPHYQNAFLAYFVIDTKEGDERRKTAKPNTNPDLVSIINNHKSQTPKGETLW